MARIIQTELDELHGKRAVDWRVPPGFYCAAIIEDGNGGQHLSLLDIPEDERSIASMQAWCARQVGRAIDNWRCSPY